MTDTSYSEKHPIEYMDHDEGEESLSPELTWPYLIQDIMDEIFRRKLSLIIVVAITLFSAIAVSILPFFEKFWETPYAVGILIFLGSFTVIPIMYFYSIIYLNVRKKRSSKDIK